MGPGSRVASSWMVVSADAAVLARGWRFGVVPDADPLLFVLRLEEQEPGALGGEARAEGVTDDADASVDVGERNVDEHVMVAGGGAVDAAELLPAERGFEGVFKC